MLSLRGVGFRYPLTSGSERAALADADLEVAAGELVLVLGATGSGKSTLLRIAAGLLAASEGVAVIDDVALTRQNARGAVGIVFQDPESQLFAESVLDDVAFGPANLGATRDDARARAARALDRVGLPSETFGPRSPFGLSGGEARRAAIAGMLAMEPRYLLLDEPTAGLDARGRAAVRAVIAAERERAGIVVVSHSAAEFLGQADRVLLLTGGRGAFYGRATDLIADPSRFEAAGLAAPEVLRVQYLAAACGRRPAEFSVDPARAARLLAEAGER